MDDYIVTMEKLLWSSIASGKQPCRTHQDLSIRNSLDEPVKKTKTVLIEGISFKRRIIQQLNRSIVQLVMDDASATEK